MNTIRASLLVFDNTNELKWPHDLVVGICWSMDELVVVIHFGKKFELVVQVFVVHQSSFLSQSHARQFDEVQACVF